MELSDSLTSVLKFRNPSLWLGFFSLVFYFLSLQNLAEQKITQRMLIAPPHGLQYFVFGMKEQMADTLWIRSIQDFDYCEQKIDKINCRNSGWLFTMLDTVTDLSPKFRIAYASGAIALSVLVSDIDGATKLFDKAVLNFPTDWSILFKAAYHALLEEKNKAKAADLLIRVAKNGGPPWTYSLAGRLYSEQGQTELAENLIHDLEEQKYPPVFIDRIKQRIAESKKKPAN